MWALLRLKIETARIRREWKLLPPGFELDAVRHLAKEIAPHVAGIIKGRVNVAQALTFDDLSRAVDLAESEHNNKVEKLS